MNTKLIKDVISVLSLRFSAFLFTYPTVILLSRKLGSDGYGIYGTVMAIVPLIATFIVFGKDQLLVKNIPEQQAKTISGFYRLLLQSLPVVVLTFIIIYWANMGYEFFSLEVVFCVFALIILHTKRRLITGVLRGFLMPIPTQIAENIIQPAITLLLLFVSVTLFTLDVIDALLCTILGTLVSVVYLTPILSSKLAPSSLDTSKLTLAASFPFFGLAITNDIATYIDRIMLSSIVGFEASGVYLVVARNAALLLIAVSAVQLVVNPYIADFKKNSTQENLQELAQNQTFYQTLLSLIGLIPVIGVAHYVAFIFGDEFASAKAPLIILATGYAVSMVLGSGIQYLFMTNHSKAAFFIVALSAVVNVVGNLFLIPVFGIYGAVYATLFSEFFKKGTALIYVRAQLSINVDLFTSIRQKVLAHD